MDSVDIEYAISLKNDFFYQHIENSYGKLVVKILKYHDIDSYKLLNQVTLKELIDLFEKPDDENSTDTLLNLKKEICSVYQNMVSLKIGTKNKLISLLKSAHDIMRKKRLQSRSEKRSSRINQYRSTSSSNEDINIVVNDSLEKYEKSLEESIDKLLMKSKGEIHGAVLTDFSVKDFKILFERETDLDAPTCSIRCVCGDRIKLYYKSQHFQLSNLSKHLSVKKNELSRRDQDHEEFDESESPDISQSSNKENSRPGTNNSLNASTYSDTLAPTEKNHTSSGTSRLVPEGNRHGNSSAISSKNRSQTTVGLTSNRLKPRNGETSSSISILNSINKKKQMLHSQQRQTTTSLPGSQSEKSLHSQEVNSMNLSRSKKRKYDADEDYHQSKSTTRNSRRVTEEEILFEKISSSDILSVLLKTIQLNINRTSNNYRYDPSVLRFAACLLILAGVYVYEFLRLNFKYLLPSIPTVNNVYKENPYTEGQFRFDEAKNYLDSINCQYAFVSEDCSCIIPRIEYDSTFNCFNGFVTPIIDGKPIENAFQCNSFEEFQDLFTNHSRSNLVNVHLLQPISTSNRTKPSATVLAAYGTDSKISSIEILKRWLMILFELRSRNIFVLGFSTDGDPKYLRSMRLGYNFFVKQQTINISNDNLSFRIEIPLDWSSWYFLNPNQLMLFFQDGVHLCNKMRNRLLSKKVYLHMGLHKISVQHLHQLLETTNKIDTNLSKSDLIVQDKQNFSSCQKICNEKVLNLLALNNDYNGTYVYLLLIHLLIIVYTEGGVSLSTRILYGWIVVFFVRLWRLWLFKSRKTRRSFKEKTTASDRNYFITSNALLSIEINAHTLIFICLLIDQGYIPESVADSVHLFSSQPCESIFRDARSLSGIYSTRINFTIKQFLQRMNKLNALMEIKQFESANTRAKIVFPIHHKIKRMNTSSEFDRINERGSFDSDHIERLVICAYEVAQELLQLVGMDKNLIKHKLFDIEDSSKMSKHLLQLNILTESEILVLDDEDDESDNEEDGFIAEEGEDGDDDDDEGEVDLDDYEEKNGDDQYEGNHDRDGDEQEIYYDYPSDDDQPSTSTFENVQSTSYSGLRLVQPVPSTHAHKYFPVYIQKKKFFLHKATAAWYMQEKQAHVPGDRLRRVQFKEV